MKETTVEVILFLHKTNHLPRIAHARKKGERRIVNGTQRLLVDGYDAQTRTAYEFQGCFYHGCLDCFPNRTMRHPIHQNQTMRDVRQKTRMKIQFRVHWPTKNNRHLKILWIDKMQNSTSLCAIPSSSTMEVRIKTTLPVVQNMRATKHKTSTPRKKRQVPPFCRGKMPHRYLDNPGTTKSCGKEVRHHVHLRSLAF